MKERERERKRVKNSEYRISMLIIFRPIDTSDTLLLEGNQFPDICLIFPTPKYYTIFKIRLYKCYI